MTKKSTTKTKKPAPSSAAVIALRALVERDGVREVAREVGTDEGTLRAWLRDRRPARPSAAAKAAVAARYPVPVRSWSEPADAAPIAKVPALALPLLPPLAADATPLEQAQHAVQEAAHDLATARAEGRGALAVARLRTAHASALRVLGRFAGVAGISEATIVRTPGWARIMAVFAPLAREYENRPTHEFVRAYADALEKLAAEGGG